MQERYLPPTRRSILLTGAVKYFGPHHFFISSGEVHACHTFSRGASKMRVMVNSSLFLISLAILTYLLVSIPGLRPAPCHNAARPYPNKQGLLSLKSQTNIMKLN